MPDVELTAGYVPGAISAIVALHAQYYKHGFALGLAFEARVAIEISSFLLNLDPACDSLIIATSGGSIIGSITVDGRTLGPMEAQLRWFVFDSRHGGVESALMQEALKFCVARNFRRVLISTVEGSPLVDRLTHTWGFNLFHQSTGHQWDRPIEEILFERGLTAH